MNITYIYKHDSPSKNIFRNNIIFINNKCMYVCMHRLLYARRHIYTSFIPEYHISVILAVILIWRFGEFCKVCKINVHYLHYKHGFLSINCGCTLLPIIPHNGILWRCIMPVYIVFIWMLFYMKCFHIYMSVFCSYIYIHMYIYTMY